MSNSPKNIKINDSHETRIALLEQSIGHIGQTLLRIESRIDNLDKSLNIRIDKLDARIDKVENKLWQILFLISSSIIGMILGKIFHLL
jgi:hypothetical protein